MTDYATQLRRELSDLRTRRVNLRHKIDKVRLGFRIAGDTRDVSELCRVYPTELAATDKRWFELHSLLQIPLPSGRGIKIATPDGRSLYRTVQPAPVQRTPQTAPVRRAVPTSGYMNKMLTGR